MPSAPRFVLLGFLATIAASGAAVHVWQDSLELPTYLEHDPDPEPEFPSFPLKLPDIPNATQNYPYPVRSGVSARPEDRTPFAWRTLNLENEYLMCRVLPDLGGHIYNCRDKISQREIFYANPVIKKDLIGLRGAWIATGIEPDFPATHSRVSASPVNFLTRSYADGSASVIVGATDRVTGMSWRVEYHLRPESTVLEEQVSLYNPTPERHPYLWWNNAEIEADDPEMRLIVPTKLMISHDRKTLESWPVNSAGVDMSLVANDKKEVTWFAFQCHDNFMAIYKPKSRTGVAHYADPKIVTGKKIWLMGDFADAYRRRLTDNANAYVEIQAGLFGDQQAYRFLNPEESRTFMEYWVPFRDLDGVTRASADAVLYAERNASQGELTVSLIATHPLAGARIRVIGDTRVIWEGQADLDPKAAWRQSVKLPKGETFGVELLDRSGHVLLEHDERRSVATEGLKAGPQKVPDWDTNLSEFKLLERGEHHESLGQDALAYYDYSDGLKAFPGDPLLEKAEARLALSNLRLDEAANLFQKLLTGPRPSAEVFYYAGIAQSLAGHDDAARPLLLKATATSAFASPAAVELAMIASRANDFAGALKLPEPSPKDPLQAARIGGIRTALFRHNKDVVGAARELAKWRAVAPEDPFLRYEATIAGIADAALWSYLAGDAERVLNIADEYMQLGMRQDALALMQHDFSKDNPHFVEPGAVSPERSALLFYYRAYSEIALKLDPSADLHRASELGTRYMFPNRATSYAVLRSAIERNPSDATAHALMGNLEMDALRAEDAIAEWGKAIALNPKLDVEREDIKQASALVHRQPQRIPKPILETKVDVRRAPAAARPVPVKAPVPLPAASSAPNESPLALAESALLKSVSSSPDSAVEVFRGPQFASDKQPPAIRQAYIEIQLQSLLALAAAGKCDTLEDRIQGLPILEDSQVPFVFHGFTEFMKAAHFQYYLGVAEENCGKPKQARKFWSKVAKMNEDPSSPDFAYPLLAASMMNSSVPKGAVSAAMKTVDGVGSLDPGLRALDRGLLLRAASDPNASGELAKALTAKDAMVKYLAASELTRKLR